MMSKAILKNISKIKCSLRNNERHTLPSVIVKDLMLFGKIPLCLFICIVITAITVVATVYYTRLLIIQHDQLVLERNALDIEWRNLILEENALSDHSRLEKIAKEKLQLHYVDPSKENIIVQNEDKYDVYKKQ